MTTLASYHRAAREMRNSSIKLSATMRRLTELRPGEVTMITSPRAIDRLIAEAHRLAPRAALRASVKSADRPLVAKTYIVERVA